MPIFLVFTILKGGVLLEVCWIPLKLSTYTISEIHKIKELVEYLTTFETEMTPYHYLQKSQIIDSISYRYQMAAYLKAEKALGSISQPMVYLPILCHLTTKINQLVGDMSAIERLRIKW